MIDEKMMRMNDAVDWSFSESDLECALQRINDVASKHRATDPRCASLAPFQGSKMTPAEFRQMLYVTFSISLTDKELGALGSFH